MSSGGGAWAVDAPGRDRRDPFAYADAQPRAPPSPRAEYGGGGAWARAKDYLLDTWDAVVYGYEDEDDDLLPTSSCPCGECATDAAADGARPRCAGAPAAAPSAASASSGGDSAPQWGYSPQYYAAPPPPRPPPPAELLRQNSSGAAARAAAAGLLGLGGRAVKGLKAALSTAGEWVGPDTALPRTAQQAVAMENDARAREQAALDLHPIHSYMA